MRRHHQHPRRSQSQKKWTTGESFSRSVPVPEIMLRGRLLPKPGGSFPRCSPPTVRSAWRAIRTRQSPGHAPLGGSSAIAIAHLLPAARCCRLHRYRLSERIRKMLENFCCLWEKRNRLGAAWKEHKGGGSRTATPPFSTDCGSSNHKSGIARTAIRKMEQKSCPQRLSRRAHRKTTRDLLWESGLPRTAWIF